nr:hypothetical protein [Tanacetum cinerariifolium]
MALTFADTHNMIAYLTKSYASEGLEQIIDFLNASAIQYALTVNPNIYVSCIKQFWSSVLVKKVNDVMRLQALIDRKKLMIHAQVGDLSSHTTKYSSPALTQKQVADVADEVTGGVDVDNVVAEDAAEPTPPSPTPTTQPPPPSQELPSTSREDASKQRGIIADLDGDKNVTLEEVDAAKDAEIKENADAQGRQAHAYHIDLGHDNKVLSMHDDEPEPAKLKEVGVVIRDPEETATPSTIIHSEPKFKDKGKGIMVQEPKPLKKQAQIEQDEAYARELEAELKKKINWDAVIKQVKEKGKQDNVMLRYQALKRKPQTEAEARKNMIVYLKNMDGFKMDYFKGMSYDDIRPIFEKYFNSNVAFLEKTKEQLEEEESRALKRKIKVQKSKHSKRKSWMKREDLEMLWQLVKERFSSSKPNNFSDDFLLTTLKAMFKKPNMILMVKRRYPLTRFTLDQMLNNVRLEVKEESEVSLELLSFGVDAAEDFKENMLRDYCCWLKTYCCWCKLMLLDDAADIKLRLLEQNVVDERMKANTKYLLLLEYLLNDVSISYYCQYK